MSKRFLLILLLFFLFLNIGLTQEVRLTSQADIDAFDTSISSIEGSLIIDGDDIFDLSNLSNLTSVKYSLTINDNIELENLDGLDNLAFIGGFLNITDKL